MRINITRAEAVLTYLARSPLLRSRAFFGTLSVFVILGLVATVRLLQVSNFTASLQGLTMHWQRIVEIALFIFVTTTIHEFGHAVVCTRFGAPVRSMGVMIFYLQPAAFADITDSWRLQNKWHRVAISAAGVYVQAVVNAVAAMCLLYLRSSGRTSPLLLLCIAMNLSSMAINLVPLVKLDGYWMLSAVLGIPNLRDRGLEWVQVFTSSLLSRSPIQESTLRFPSVLLMSPLGRALLFCFGISSRSFSVAMWAAGASFLFRIVHWMGFTGGRGTISVSIIIALLAATFAIRWFRTRQQPATRSGQSVATVSPAVAPTLTYAIDRERSIQLNPFASVMYDQQERMVFAWTSPSEVAISANSELTSLLPSLRSGVRLNSVSTSGKALQRDTEEAIQRLWHLKHLRYSSEWSPAETQDRYSRQFGWLSMNSAVKGSELFTMERLRKKRITILGVGGVGSNVSLTLAACGIGAMHLVDGDTVEITNLNRQLLYTPNDVGRSKVEVAAEKLRQFNPDLMVRTSNIFVDSVESIMEVIKGSDFVVRSLDTPMEAQIWVNEACVRSGIPCCGAGFLAQGAVVGPTVVPGVTACMACQDARLPRVERGIGGTLSPVVTMAAGFLANEVVTHLAGLGPVRTANHILLLDAPTLSITFQPIPRNHECPVCGERKEKVA